MFSTPTHPTRPRLLRSVAALTAFALCWLSVGPALAAGNHRATPPSGITRALSVSEMGRIMGGQKPGGGGGFDTGTHYLSLSPASGTTYPWEGSAGGANTGNGNKNTDLPIVGWKARGGMSVSLSLVHNSEGNHNSELGHKWTHSYDIYLLPDTSTGDITVHWGNDLAYPFTQNIDGTFTAPTGIHDTFVQTGTGTSATYTLTTKAQVKYTFGWVSDGAGGGGWYCGSITDRNGNTITITHNAAGFVTSVTDPTSRSISLTYTSGRITGVSDPLSRTWTLAYDSNGDLASVSFPAVGSTTYSITYGYNTNHDITSLTDARGKVWAFDYFSDDSIKSETDPLSHQSHYVYNTGVTKVYDARGNYVTHNYTSSGVLASVTDEAGNTESYTYDSDHNKTGVTDKRGKVWGYTFDSRGNVLTATDPLGHTTTTTYNSKSDPLTVTTQLGHETDYAYTSAGNLHTVTDPLGHVKTLAYDTYGQPTSIKDGLNHETTITYDTDGNTTQTTDALSHSTTATYDAIGRTLTATDATGLTSSTTYDALGRVTSVTAPGSRTTTFAYAGGSGLKVSVTDPLSHASTFVYDDAGRVTSHTDANGNTVYFAYDASGNKTGFTDGNGHTTAYTYDSRNEVTGIGYPDSTGETYTYLADGKVHTKTDGRGVTATSAYDDAGRLTGVGYSDTTHSVSVSYDSDNRKTSMVDGTGATTYSYDNASRLTQRAEPNGTVSFGYDAGNRLTSRTLGSGTTSNTYDNANRLTGVTAPGASSAETTAYTYDAAGRKLTATFANGDTEADTYSTSTGELLSVVHATSGSATIASHTYTYRADGRKTGETTADGSVVSYGYDVAGQLTSESKVDSSSTTLYSLSYTYDGAGNRLSKTAGSATETYTYDSANKLTAAGAKSYTYDNAGNVASVTNSTTGVTTNLSFDGESRLTAIDNGTTATVNASYAYNGLDQRTGRTDSTSTTYAYTRAGDAIDAPVLSDGQATYTQGNGLISEVRGSASKFYKADGLGTTRALTGSTGTTTDTLSTDAFGNTVASSGTSVSPFGFAGGAGYQSDADTGLMLLGHRYYDPSTGRFLSRDPIRAGLNWYTYCGNDPVNGSDPTGEIKVVNFWRFVIWATRVLRVFAPVHPTPDGISEQQPQNPPALRVPDPAKPISIGDPVSSNPAGGTPPSGGGGSSGGGGGGFSPGPPSPSTYQPNPPPPNTSLPNPNPGPGFGVPVGGAGLGTVGAIGGAATVAGGMYVVSQGAPIMFRARKAISDNEGDSCGNGE